MCKILVVGMVATATVTIILSVNHHPDSGCLTLSAKGGKDRNTVRVSWVAFATACTACGLKQRILYILSTHRSNLTQIAWKPLWVTPFRPDFSYPMTSSIASRNSRGVKTDCPLQASAGKCLLFPVSSASAPTAAHASRKGSSSSSGK